MARWVCVALMLALGVPAAAQTGSERLRAFLSEFKTLSAGFEQTVYEDGRRPLETTRGEVLLSRPDRFRWTYRAPYEQTIVADGRQVWVYDRDLAQVTVQPLDRTIGTTPALLLSSQRSVDDDFEVVDLEPADGLAWVGLAPRDGDGDFTRIRFGFEGGTLRRMDLHDSFGNVTRVTFTDVRRNVALDADAFDFTPPPGVDVIDARR